MTSTSSTYRGTTANNERRGTASKDLFSSNRSRVPSALLPDQGLRTTQSPQSPTNSIFHKRAQSDSRKSSIDAESNGQRRTERSYVTTRETLSIRTRSPVKDGGDAYAPVRKPREEQKGVIGGRAGTERLTAQRKEKEALRGPWNPQVQLVPHTTAPLASRVSTPPSALQVPRSLYPCHLTQLSLEAQEATILEELMYVLMGFEGQYIQFVESYNPAQEKDRLSGPRFRILSGLDPSLRDLTLTMLKMATHHAAVEAFIEVHSREEFGSINHALCAAMRRYLKEYLEMIVNMEEQFLTDPGFTLHILHLHTLPTNHIFAQLYTLIHEILRRNRMLEADHDDSIGSIDDVETILESLREGGEFALGKTPGKMICKGGGVLELLTRRLAAMSGDPAARALLTDLLREASRPYMVLLNEWLHHGGIRDPHAEFLVKEQKSIRRERLEQDYTDEYWEKRYTLRENDVPPQLEGVKEKVLLAGKYLNVVRECGGVDVSKEVKDVPKTFDDPSFLDNVNSAYAYANSSLLNLLLTTHALPARLRSLKHYFFLDRSDFFSYFLELGTSELKKPARMVNVNKLQSLLDLVLRQPGSVAAQDPFKEDIKVQMNEVGLTKWLMRVVSVSGLDQDSGPGGGTGGGLFDSHHHQRDNPRSSTATADDDKDIHGFNALELDYSVPFPLSLVISRKTVLRYQLLFRYLLSLRHLETLLVGSWNEHTKAVSWRHKSSNPRLEMWKRRAWTLRARMLVFVQQLLYFCTAEVIEPNWQALIARLEGRERKEGGHAATVASASSPSAEVKQPSRTVDELMQDHVDFLDTCLKECMLTNSKLIRIHSKIMTTCTWFATYTARLSRDIIPADPDLSSPSQPPSTPNPPPPPSQTQPQTTSPSAPTTTTTTTTAPLSASPHPTPTANTGNTPTLPTHDPAMLDKLSDNLQKYEDNFSRHLRILLDALNYYAATETVVLLGLCARLSTASEGADMAGHGHGGAVVGFREGV